MDAMPASVRVTGQHPPHMIRVRMPHTMRTDPLHNPGIIPPVQRPARHMMITRGMNDTRETPVHAGTLIMHPQPFYTDLTVHHGNRVKNKSFHYPFL
jgi:hypothetical protein